MLVRSKRALVTIVLAGSILIIAAQYPLRVAFSQSTPQSDARFRLTPSEIAALPQLGASAGTSGVSGIQTRLLKGDPTKPGLYTIELRVPANTRIQAHTHPDDRTATVVSGTWYLGYGDHHESAKLKALPPGSFYTEPPGDPHFARTGSVPVVLHISGVGPKGTHYKTNPPAPVEPK
jgi:quercetin dioxygenase-like cupin family protein